VTEPVPAAGGVHTDEKGDFDELSVCVIDVVSHGPVCSELGTASEPAVAFKSTPRYVDALPARSTPARSSMRAPARHTHAPVNEIVCTSPAFHVVGNVT
jgi:hypothetical protein